MNAIMRWFNKPVFKCMPVISQSEQLKDAKVTSFEYRLEGVTGHTALNGFYMLELKSGVNVRPSLLHVNVCYHNNKQENRFFTIPLKPGFVSKRIVHFSSAVEYLQFTCDHEITALNDFEFKFIPVNRFVANKHIQKKLKNNRIFEGYASSKVKVDTESIWSTYNRMFNKASSLVSYQDWIKNIEPLTFNLQVSDSDLLFSIIVPVYNAKASWLKQLAESVHKQSYHNWQLIFVDDASPSHDTLKALDAIAQQDPRLSVIKRTSNGHICLATNDGIKQAIGDYVVFLDHDDLLSPQALNELAHAINQQPSAKFIYSDEDLMTEQGARIKPHFKPDWNLDLLLSHNYITHLTCYERSFLNDLNGMRLGYEGAQDYDLVLRASKILKHSEIVHIPKILYHWRMVEGSTASDAANKSYATRAGLKAVQDYLESTSSNARACHDTRDNFYKIKWPLPSQGSAPVLSIIIPTRNGLDVLKPCIESLIETTQYQKLELVIVDNGTDESEALEYLKYLNNEYLIKSQAKPFTVKVIEDHGDFNFSRLINAGVNAASGEVLLLLNNDTQAIEFGWLQEMLSHTLRKDIGCVGAKLLYPDETIQHAGVIMGLGGYAAHSHRGVHRYAAGYFCRAQVVQNLSALTAACLMVRRDVFEQVNGFDESFAVAYNDVDFCLRVREAGYRNLYTPFAELYHHESKTRGEDTCVNKQARFNKEKENLLARWQPIIDHDPAYNPNLTRSNEEFSIGSL